MARHPGTRPQPARAASFRRPVAVTSTRPKLSGAVRPGRHGRLMVTAVVARSRVACRDGWQSPCDEPRITCPETRGSSLMTGPLDPVPRCGWPTLTARQPAMAARGVRAQRSRKQRARGIGEVALRWSGSATPPIPSHPWQHADHPDLDAPLHSRIRGGNRAYRQQCARCLRSGVGRACCRSRSPFTLVGMSVRPRTCYARTGEL